VATAPVDEVFQRGIMSINWFPGHMHKARKEIRAVMSKVAFVIEILDARIPFSSENPLVSELRGDRPCIKVLKKSDLADPTITEAWLSYFEEQPGVIAVPLQKGETVRARAILDRGRNLLPADWPRQKQMVAMILGIPNVGKSTLINTLAGRKIAKASNVPAVTQRQQRIQLRQNFALLDTPGFLWPKLSPESCGYRLGVTGAIRDAVVEYEDLAFFAVEYLKTAYPERIQKRYDLADLPPDEMGILEAIAARRGCIGRGGHVNLQKVSELVIRELRQGALGRISLETPALIAAEQAAVSQD
jgi:ribosome biogenesis GTPase A